MKGLMQRESNTLPKTSHLHDFHKRKNLQRDIFNTERKRKQGVASWTLTPKGVKLDTHGREIEN